MPYGRGMIGRNFERNASRKPYSTLRRTPGRNKTDFERQIAEIESRNPLHRHTPSTLSLFHHSNIVFWRLRVVGGENEQAGSSQQSDGVTLLVPLTTIIFHVKFTPEGTDNRIEGTSPDDNLKDLPKAALTTSSETGLRTSSDDDLSKENGGILSAAVSDFLVNADFVGGKDTKQSRRKNGKKKGKKHRRTSEKKPHVDSSQCELPSADNDADAALVSPRNIINMSFEDASSRSSSGKDHHPDDAVESENSNDFCDNPGISLEDIVSQSSTREFIGEWLQESNGDDSVSLPAEKMRCTSSKMSIDGWSSDNNRNRDDSSNSTGSISADVGQPTRDLSDTDGFHLVVSKKRYRRRKLSLHGYPSAAECEINSVTRRRLCHFNHNNYSTRSADMACRQVEHPSKIDGRHCSEENQEHKDLGLSPSRQSFADEPKAEAANTLDTEFDYSTEHNPEGQNNMLINLAIECQSCDLPIEESNSMGYVDIDTDKNSETSSSCTDRSHIALPHDSSGVMNNGKELANLINAVGDAYTAQMALDDMQRVGGSRPTNIEAFLLSATPVVCHVPCTQECDICTALPLADSLYGKHVGSTIPLSRIWQWYEQAGAYGVEVKVQDLLYQTRHNANVSECSAFFVPYLSAIQLFGRPCNAGGNVVMSSSTCVTSISLGPSDRELIFEYFEAEQPPMRRPLFQKIKELVHGGCGNRESLSQKYGDPSVLETLKLGDLHPASWFAVAWYPIYSIPHRKLRASFLTYHSFHKLAKQRCSLEKDGSTPVVSPVIGLQSYNDKMESWFQPRIFSSDRSKSTSSDDAGSAHLPQLLQSLLKALKHSSSAMSTALVPKGNEKVANRHPDYEFFQSRG